MFPLDRESCTVSSSNLFGQKSVFTLNCKFLQTLRHIAKTIDPVINVYILFHRCSVYIYRQQGVYWIVWSVLLTFLTTLIVYFIKRVDEIYWCSGSIACQEKWTDRILKILTSNDKNLLCLPIIKTLQFIWRVKAINE